MKFIQKGCFLSALAIILGAFGAHAIKGKITSELFDVYQTATYYLFIHAIAIILYGFFCTINKRTTKRWPGILFLIGILLFSGSLYLIVLTNIKGFGIITPLGGLSFIIAWIGFGMQARHRIKNGE
jgi:uncharacterized membrane protein YgdD (TMEM256/DUF423 family)